MKVNALWEVSVPGKTEKSLTPHTHNHACPSHALSLCNSHTTPAIPTPPICEQEPKNPLDSKRHSQQLEMG